MAKKSSIGKLASTDTKKEFAENLSSYTTLSAKEIEDLFPKQTDREELLTLLEIVSSAKDENSKKADLISKIGDVGGAVIKLVKRFTVGL
ncbi:MAG: hypothetical protein ACYC09_14735 [Bacteroidota bacterium]